MPRPAPPLGRLACMAAHMDGAHCGLTDWYPDIEKGLQQALQQGSKAQWTTGWYSSKKAIASACISHYLGRIQVAVSVTDDFDTPGMGVVMLPHTRDLAKLRYAIDRAWDKAEADRKDNQQYVGFSVLRQRGGVLRWVETYVEPVGMAVETSKPPGDNYARWGFQGECKVPPTVKGALARWVSQWIAGEKEDETEFTYRGWTIRPWKDD